MDDLIIKSSSLSILLKQRLISFDLINYDNKTTRDLVPVIFGEEGSYTALSIESRSSQPAPKPITTRTPTILSGTVILRFCPFSI